VRAWAALTLTTGGDRLFGFDALAILELESRLARSAVTVGAARAAVVVDVGLAAVAAAVTVGRTNVVLQTFATSWHGALVADLVPAVTADAFSAVTLVTARDAVAIDRLTAALAAPALSVSFAKRRIGTGATGRHNRTNAVFGLSVPFRAAFAAGAVTLAVATRAVVVDALAAALATSALSTGFTGVVFGTALAVFDALWLCALLAVPFESRLARRALTVAVARVAVVAN
jgi:hypothetical protein